MARDYKSRATPGSRKQKHSSGWTWLFAGYLLGCFTVGLIWLKFSNPEQDNWIGSKPGTTAAASKNKEEKPENKVTPPRFDFYNMLPEMEVVIPEEELNTQPLANRDKDGNIVIKKHLLQVGSFKQQQDAEKLKAQLALLGHQAKISKSQSGNQTWHRVRLGPYQGNKQLNKAKKDLALNGHDALLIRVK